jgi:hypothetical protein
VRPPIAGTEPCPAALRNQFAAASAWRAFEYSSSARIEPHATGSPIFGRGQHNTSYLKIVEAALGPIILSRLLSE